MAIFTILRGEIHNSIQHKLQNSMEVDSVGIIAILSISYITTRIVKTQTSVAKIPRVPVENPITTPSVVKIAIKFSPCVKVCRHFYQSDSFLKFENDFNDLINFASLLRKLSFREKKIAILVSRYSEQSKTSRNVIFI